MNVSLTEELESWIEGRVSSGLYRSSSEVVREALRTLREREELKEVRREEYRRLVREGLEDYNAGKYIEFDESVLASVMEEGRRRLASAK